MASQAPITTTRSIRKRGAAKSQPHSIRVNNETWAGARQRAESEGSNINAVTAELLEGYRRGVYKLPKRRVVVEREYDAASVAATTAAASA